MSDVNLVLTEHARRYLIAEGIRPETIIRTGSHMPEVLKHYSQRIDDSRATETAGVEPGKYFNVSVHREENVVSPENLQAFRNVLDALCAAYELSVIVSASHPRTRKRLDNLSPAP